MGFFSFLGDVVSCIGSAIASFAGSLIEKLSPVISIALQVVKDIGEVVVAVANALGLIPEDESVEEIGAKTMQDGVRAKMEDESMQEYLDYLRNDVKLDEGKLAVMTDEESDAEPDTITAELQKGYMYKDQVLRHSMVKVKN
mgnify:CR=1 FL=1